MLKIKANQISLNDVIYYTGDMYSSHHEVTKIIVKSINFREHSEDEVIEINNTYWLYKSSNDEYWYNRQLFFSEKKANNVVNNYILQQQQRKRKYEKEKEIEEKYKQQIVDDKLEEKYIDKFVMINRGEDGWIKTKVKEVFATEDGIYLEPHYFGHICKLSREGKTWKMWSELEELEEQKRKLEDKIKKIKGEENE